MKFNPILLSLVLLHACTPTPQPIEYGADICTNCQMTIVDRQHAAELVTKKGRNYKFDAVECLVDYLGDYTEDHFALFLVNDYSNPEILVDARQCTYLITPQLPSPMGAFLHAFEKKSVASEFQKDFGGDLYTWESLKKKIYRDGISGH